MTMIATQEAGCSVAPGWHEVEMPAYLAWPFVSSSCLGVIAERPPAYVRWYLDQEDNGGDTASKTLGSLAHTAIFEPDLLDALYICEPYPDPDVFTTGDGKRSDKPKSTAKWKAAIAELEKAGKSVVSVEEMENAKSIRDSVFANKRARQLIQAEGPIEISGFVEDPETGVPLKIRPDKLVPAIGANVNLKTSMNASPAAFSRAIYSFYYDRSMGFYKIALEALGFEHKRPIIIAAETTGPKLVAVRELDEGTMHAGEEHARAILRKIAGCFEQNRWPGYPEEVVSQSLPHWAWAKRDETLQELEYGY